MYEATGESSGAPSSPVAESPPASTVPAGTSADASIQPGADGLSPASQNEPGPVPDSRFKEVNSKYQALKWAESHDPQAIGQQQAFFQWLDRDPEGAFRYLEDYLGRSGALKKAPPADTGNGRPQADVVVPETGQRFYSAEAAEKLAKWQAEALLNERLTPIEKTLREVEADRVTSRARGEAQRMLSEAEAWPYYKDHEADILRAMQADKRLSLEGAYNRVVVPKMRGLEREAVLKELHDKRQASTVNPGSSAPSERVAAGKMSWTDLFKRELAKRTG